MSITDNSLATTSNPLDMDELEISTPDYYEPTENDEKKVKRIIRRKTEMALRRRQYEPEWELADKGWKSYWRGDPNGKATMNAPIEFSFVNTYLAETRKRPVITDAESIGIGNTVSTKIIKKIIDFDRKSEERDIKFSEDDFIVARDGTSIMFVDYQINRRVINDVEIDDDTGKLKNNKQMEIKKGIIMENVDLRDFYVDERANSIEEAVDCMLIRYMPAEEFLQLQNDPSYKNILKVNLKGGQIREGFTRDNDDVLQSSKLVKVTIYFNKQSDEQVVIANDRVVVRDTPLLNPKHELPFIHRKLFPDASSFYSRGLPQIVRPYKSNINMTMSMIIEGVKRSSNETIMVGPNFTVDGETFSYNNTILRANQALSPNNFQQIKGTPADPQAWELVNSLFTHMVYMTKMDITNVAQGSASKTAYQDALQEEKSSEGILLSLQCRDQAYESGYNRIIMPLLQKYFPKKKVIGLVPIEGGKADMTQATMQTPTIPLQGQQVADMGGTMDIIPSEDDGYIEVTDEIIRGNFKIKIFTNYNSPSLNQNKKVSVMETLNNIIMIEQMSAQSRYIEANKEDLIKDQAEMGGLALDIRTESPEVKRQLEELDAKMARLAGMEQAPQGMQGGQLPVPPGQPPEIPQPSVPPGVQPGEAGQLPSNIQMNM